MAREVTRVAPGLQQSARGFIKSLGWRVEGDDARALECAKSVAGGHNLRWRVHFEDEKSLSQAPAPEEFASKIASEARNTHLFDLVITDEAVRSGRWKNTLAPALDKKLRGLENCRYGTLGSLFGRFSRVIADAYEKRVAEYLKGHFVQKPIQPCFIGTEMPASKTVMEKMHASQGQRILLVTGEAGSGKSVFALMLVRELHGLLRQDPAWQLAPFLVWFSFERPPTLNDLLALTLRDLGLSQEITTEALLYLLKQGHILLILDGFDEVSRALAQNAEQNVKELAENINKDSLGRLILTSRPSFIEQEQVFASLEHECGVGTPETQQLAPYTDEQMHQWVLQNAPTSQVNWIPEKHWQRIQTAFHHEGALRELCRTPVFLRMLSEVLVKDKSVRSLNELLETFCLEMWERERSKRTLTLRDEQYFYAYETIALMIADDKRITPGELKENMELYMEEYSPELLAGLPDDAATLIADLAIGPLSQKNGGFAFVHEVLHAYFLSRALARSIRSASAKKVAELWNRSVTTTVWKFLPEAVGPDHPSSKPKEAFLREIANTTQSGLVMWNIAKAIGVPPTEIPGLLFEGKQIASLLCQGTDLSGVSFKRATILSATFDKCIMSGASFYEARIEKIKFVQCGQGALFDQVPLTSEESEVTIVRGPGSDEEVYVGEGIPRILGQFMEKEEKLKAPPSDLSQQALVLIFRSLFKVDHRRLDYPEKRKIENRLRAWLRGFDLEPEQYTILVRILTGAVDKLGAEGWIERNKNRPRTLVPSNTRMSQIRDIVRTGKIGTHLTDLVKVVDQLRDDCDRSLADA